MVLFAFCDHSNGQMTAANQTWLASQQALARSTGRCGSFFVRFGDFCYLRCRPRFGDDGDNGDCPFRGGPCIRADRNVNICLRVAFSLRQQ
ncbi:hypothetical protein niasHS_000893 [Heterodera schachtii]|uniref:Uncharacterized protein n=1 Tax=Heterodera schachtii TaxID=97005 RepID=A0ABD2KIU9_HETSC